MSLAWHMRRWVTRLLAVAVVMIVAGLGASAAQALPSGHEGHRIAHVQSSAASVTGPVAKAVPVLEAAAGAHDRCSLCCPTCMACCHSLLMPAATTAPLPSARPLRVALAQAAMPPGPAPEALPRPPRPFA